MNITRNTQLANIPYKIPNTEYDVCGFVSTTFLYFGR